MAEDRVPASVASVTTAYNAAHLLPRQIEALLLQTRALQEIIVVDNGSDDNTLRLLAERYPQVTVLRMPENLGAAGAWSAGLEYAALKQRHDWVWAFDDDSVPENAALGELMEATEPVRTRAESSRSSNGENGEIGMISALPVHAETGACYPPLLWREGFVKPSAEMLREPVWFADLAFTSGSMVRREMVEKIGLPRSDFFMDFFDFEYCLRARSHGYRIAVVTGVRLAHEVGHARQVRLPGFSGLWPNHAPWREYYISRNLAYAVWWLYPSRRAKRFTIRHLARHAGGVLLFGTDKLASLKKMAQGFSDGRRARLGIRFRPNGKFVPESEVNPGTRPARMTNPQTAARSGLGGTEDMARSIILPSDPQVGFAPPAMPARRARSSESSFARHLVLFSLANLGSLVGNGVLTFLLPRWLSMESYGYYRLFVLYGGFSGALHLGLLDGALIRWAARSPERLQAEMRQMLIFLLLQHGVLLAPAMAVLVVWFRHQPWFFLVAAILLYALVWNAAVLGQFALQADKSFGLLSAVTVIHPALLLAIVATLTHWRHLTLEALLGAYLGAWLAAAIALWIVLLAKHPGKIGGTEHVWHTGLFNIRVGWSVLLAGLLTNLALSLDRIAVSMSFSILDFAIYSLAATALAVVNTIILSISRVVFPYLSDGLATDLRIRAYAWGEATLMGLWALSLAGYFPLRLLIGRLLPAYQPSLPVLRPLMLSTGLTAVIYILHANYFRSSRRQARLLAGACAGLAAAALFLALAGGSHRLANMSWAMLGAVVVWWAVDEALLRELMHRTLLEICKTLAFASACGGSFLLCASIPNKGLGLMAYGGAAVWLTVLAYGRTLRSLPRLGLFSLIASGSNAAA
jgi:GT2 family glycosyltransferase/O-antigen/teichoic acid export membrane protein